MDTNKDIVRKGGDITRDRDSITFTRDNLTYDVLSQFLTPELKKSLLPSDNFRKEAKSLLKKVMGANPNEIKNDDFRRKVELMQGAIQAYEKLVKYITLSKKNASNALAVWNSSSMQNDVTKYLYTGQSKVTAEIAEVVYEYFRQTKSAAIKDEVYRDEKGNLKTNPSPERLAAFVFLLARNLDKGNANSTHQDKNPQPSDFTTKDERLKNPDGSYTPFNYDSGSDDDIRGDISGDNINPRNVNEGKKRKYILSEGQFKKVISKLNG